MDKAVFLDRDGVVNRLLENDYVTSWSKFEFLEGVKEAIAKLNRAGYLVIVITNQSAVNRGLMTLDDLVSIHENMLAELEYSSARVHAVYHCPHTPEDNCHCRKPETGMFEHVNHDFDIDYANSWFVGDFESDREVADRIGLRFILAKGDGGLLKAVNEILN